MTISELYVQIKYWVPIVSAFGLITKAYFSVKRGISEWANSLLQTHLGDIQRTLETIKSNDLEHLHQEIQNMPLALDRHTQTICDTQDRNSDLIIEELRGLRADLRAKK